MTIQQFITDSSRQLSLAGIKTARLDVLVLLADAFSKDKSWIIAHEKDELSPEIFTSLEQKISKRAKRYPLAYIRGHQEFYGREFVVDENVLVPRPETEALIEEFLKLTTLPGDRAIDVGTGSGAIAITLAHLRPELAVEAVDISPEALAVAQQNAKDLGANLDFYKSDLLENTKNTYRFIVANLPYVDEDWERSPETAYEPAGALFAPDNGLELIYKLLAQTPGKLKAHGYLLLEADPRQHQDIIAYAKNYHLVPVVVRDFVVVLQLTS